MRGARELGVLLVGVVSLLACLGNDATLDAPNGSTPGSPSGDASVDSAPAGPCTAEQDNCGDGTTLAKCRADGSGFDSTPCALGCAVTPDAHCRDFYPAEPVTRSDLTSGETTSITFSGVATILNSDTGAISGGLTRSANQEAAVVEVGAGIAFHLANGIGIFAFGDITIPAGAIVKVVGVAPVAFVSAGDVVIAGDINVQPMSLTGELCKANSAGPGGFPGGGGTSVDGTSGTNGSGPGGGGGGHRSDTAAQGGGGGAGHMGKGGFGDRACQGGTEKATRTFGGPAYLELRGGSGGGGGGGAAGRGGGGGGFVRIIAAKKITIGDGSSAHGINAGGCGGVGSPGGGGGGSGGAIWLAAPFVELVDHGAIAANGGGGGGNPKSSPKTGKEGQLSASPAIGAGNTTDKPWGGNGSAGDVLAGQDADTGVCNDTDSWGYGGGGAAGRIQIDTMVAPTIASTAVVSPSKSAGGAFFGIIDLH